MMLYLLVLLLLFIYKYQYDCILSFCEKVREMNYPLEWPFCRRDAAKLCVDSNGRVVEFKSSLKTVT